MALAKLIEVQRGRLSLRLFRSTDTSKFFLAVDKMVNGRRFRGPFFSEADVRCLVDLLDKHKHLRHRETKHEDRQSSGMATQGGTSVKYDRVEAQLEIAEAIRRVYKRGSSITVLPSMPKFTYRHTCCVCGSHVTSRLNLSGGVALELCPSCEHVHAATP
jgi:hypothetical protein